MMAAAITAIAGQLNQSLRRRFQPSEDLLVVSNLTEMDGSPVPQVLNKLVLMLVNVLSEPTAYRPGLLSHTASRVGLGGGAMQLNLQLMFAASFSGTAYPESLKLLSHTLAFFQARPVFDHSNCPELDGRIERLTLEQENLSIADMSNLWGVLRGTYLPSVLYRMRMLSIDADELRGQAPFIAQPQAGVRG